jgi:hypothetical protein
MGSVPRTAGAGSSKRRPIVATFIRRNKSVTKTRYYSRITTGFPRAVQLLMIDGEPGDLVEFASNEFGYQIGFVRLKVGGNMDIQWTIGE